MRLALVGTPRTGNTWLRGLLAGLYGLQQYAVHNPADIDWEELPDRSIVQVHWTRSDPFRSVLERNGFRVVTIARHPLDVLVSILHFSRREPQTRHWLSGEGDGEAAIRWAAPGDAAFEAFAKGRRAGELLGVTPSWWMDPGVAKVRYESLVTGTEETLKALAAELGATPSEMRGVIESHTLSALRPTSRNEHFWQGTPGLWQSLLTEAQSSDIAHAHAVVFETLGYSLERHVFPNKDDAALAWQQLATR